MNGKIEAIRSAVPTVVREHEESEAAREEERIALAKLLDAVVVIAKPALRAVGTRPKTAWRIWYVDSVRTDDETTLYPQRCVCLSVDAGPCCKKTEQFAGIYHGFDLFVREDGAIIQFEYDGAWSNWQGSSSGWEATVTEYPSAHDAVRDGWTDVPDYIDRLAGILQEALGSRLKATTRARENAERLTATATLLRRQ